MGKYGNSGGRNRGKKYVKCASSTPQSEARAREFMQWYGENYPALRNKIGSFDEDTASDVALHLYDCIALKGFEIKDHWGYYLRAYHTASLSKKKSLKVGLKEVPTLKTVEFNTEEREKEVEEMNNEILEYVRGKYKPYASSLFEIYLGLQPDTSYTALSNMLGIPFHRVRYCIREIVKDVGSRFKKRKNNLLSGV